MTVPESDRTGPPGAGDLKGASRWIEPGAGRAGERDRQRTAPERTLSDSASADGSPSSIPSVCDWVRSVGPTW